MNLITLQDGYMLKMENKEQIQVLMEGLDETNIASLLNKWKEINEVKKQLVDWEDALRNKIKVYMKERRWNSFLCPDNKINITLSVEKRESFDTNQLRMILNQGQLAQVTKITTFEKLIITTPEMRGSMKQYLKGGH